MLGVKGEFVFSLSHIYFRDFSKASPIGGTSLPMSPYFLWDSYGSGSSMGGWGSHVLGGPLEFCLNLPSLKLAVRT